MNAKEFNEIINKIDVDKKTKEGILELIDLKSKSNMEPILNEMKSEFKIMTSELKRIEDKKDTRNTMLMTLMGFLVALIIALITTLITIKFFA